MAERTPRGTPRREGLLTITGRVLGIALRRGCPHCGARGIWKSWFTMKDRCPTCGVRLDRGESDYFLGAYLVNLVLAETVSAVVFVICVIATWPEPAWDALLWLAGILAVVSPVIFYPITKTIWLAVDMTVRPVTDEERAGRGVGN